MAQMASYQWTPRIRAQAEAAAARKSAETRQTWRARWIDNYDDTAVRGRYVIERV